MIPDLGLGYLCTAARKEGHDTRFFDCTYEDVKPDALARKVQDEGFAAVGFKVFSTDVGRVRRHAAAVKALAPETLVFIGGPHCSGDPEMALRYMPEVDYAWQGEADAGFPQFLTWLDGGGARAGDGLRRFSGLAWREDGRVRHNPVVLADDLDQFGMPDWDQMYCKDRPTLTIEIFMERFPHVPIIATRGCPYACTFCSVPLVAGKPVRRRSNDLVMAEVERVRGRFGIRELSVVDDSFAQHRPVVVDFCEGLRRNGFGLKWNCYNGLRLRSLDPDLMRLMWDSGCHGISVGIESGSDRMLKHIKKHLTKQDIVEKVTMIRRTVPRMKILGFFILGQPGELPADVEETIQLSRDLPLDLARFSLYTPHPGTESWKTLVDAGRFSLGEYHDNDDILSCEAKGRSEHYTARALRRYYLNAVFGFHLRPRVALGILKQLCDLRKLDALARTLKTFIFATPP
jgi:radical SAM superfamily enzyme YgiQ (UPF0313 family)